MFEPVERQVVAKFARDDVGQQSRPGQPLVDRLRRLGRGRDLGIDRRGLAAFAGVGVADVPQHLERRRQVFELLAHLPTDPLAHLAAARAGLLVVGQVVLDLDARQVLGQLLAAVLVTVADATGHQRLAGLLGDARLVQRHRVDPHTEEEQLPRVEPLGLRAVEPAEDGVDLRLLLGLQPQPQGVELVGSLGLDAVDQRVVVGLSFDKNPLEQGRIIG